MALAWLLNMGFAASESSFVPPEPIKGGIPPKRERRRRRYILPDGRVFTDPDRVLFELQKLLTEAQASEEAAEAAGVSDPTAADEKPPVDRQPESGQPSAPAAPPTASMMSEIVAKLPQLLKRVQPEVRIDPAIIELIEERQAEEEAVLLAIFTAS